MAGGKLDVSKAFSQIDIADYSSGGYGGNSGSGVNRSSRRVNSRYGQWQGYHNSNYETIYIYLLLYFAYIQYLNIK